MTGMHNFKKPRQLQDRLGKAVEDFCQYSGLIYSDPFPTVFFFLERIKPTNTSNLPHTQIPLKVDIVSRHEYSSNLVDILTVLSVCVRPSRMDSTNRKEQCLRTPTLASDSRFINYPLRCPRGLTFKWWGFCNLCF